MQYLDLSPRRPTSVTLRSTTRWRLKEAVRLLESRGFRHSEQRLMRECLRFALKFWRGRKGAATHAKRYNLRRGPYEIVPFVSSETLRSISWSRCHHSGISLSRLMDFAINCYIKRVAEGWLSQDYAWRDGKDVEMWKALHEKRRKRSDFIISYNVRTEKNDKNALEYAEKSEILPWPPNLRPTFPAITHL